MDWLPLDFGRPWILLLGIAGIAFTVEVARRSIAGQSKTWHRFTLGLRITLILLLTLSLADVRA